MALSDSLPAFAQSSPRELRRTGSSRAWTSVVLAASASDADRRSLGAWTLPLVGKHSVAVVVVVVAAAAAGVAAVAVVAFASDGVEIPTVSTVAVLAVAAAAAHVEPHAGRQLVAADLDARLALHLDLMLSVLLAQTLLW